MVLSLIERYVFKKALIAVLIAIGSLVGVVWVVRAIQEVDILLSKGQGILVYLQMTTLGVPTLTAAIVPLALLIGLAHTINGLNNDSELVVMHAAGASRTSLLKPFLALGLTMSVLVYCLHLWVGPLSMNTLRGFITKVRTDLVSVIVKDGRFQDVDQGLTFHISSRAPGGILKGVFILDTRNPKETFTYLAKQGTVTKLDEQAFLVLQDGQIHRRQTKDQSLSVIKFNSYAFDLSSFSGGDASGAKSQMEISTYRLINPDPEDAYYKARPGNFRAELHTRLTGGLYPLMVTLVLLIFAGMPRSNRMGRGLAVAMAASVCLVLRGLTIVGEGSLRSEPLMVIIVWGIPMIAIVVCAMLLMSDRTIRLSVQSQARLETWWARQLERTAPLRKRLFKTLAVQEESP